MPDFSKDSKFNKEANFSSIKFGADAPLLETELNELQYIQNEKLREFIRNTFNEGVINDATLSYNNGVFTISNAKAILDGILINITNLTIPVSDGSSIYLDVWEEEVDYNSTLKKYGNNQENNIVNEIKDDRVGSETSRRKILKYDLSTSNSVPNHLYLKLGEIVNNEFISYTYENMPFMIKDIDNNKGYRFGFQIRNEGIQIISKEEI